MSLRRIPVGARKVSVINGDPVIYLGRDYAWLRGRRVYVEILYHEDMDEELEETLLELARLLEEVRRKRRERGQGEAGASRSVGGEEGGAGGGRGALG